MAYFQCYLIRMSFELCPNTLLNFGFATERGTPIKFKIWLIAMF